MTESESHSTSNTDSAMSKQDDIESLKVSELRYRRLFEAARDGILILDSKLGRITDSNPFMSELLGYTREELLGKELWEIGLLQDKEASQEAFRLLEREGYIRYEDLPLLNQRGEKREVEFVSNIYHENGHTVIQCNIRDITERKRVEADLSLASIKHAHQTAILEERTRLAQEIHDTMAQGFTGITAQLEAAQASMLSDEEIVMHADYLHIQTKLEKVRSRINKARDLARESLIETRLAVAALRSPPLDTTPLSEAIARFLAKLMVGLPIKSRYVLEGLPQLLSEELEHCLLRVGQESIANAIEHADAKEIHVELLYEIGHVKLTVKDDGKGFNPLHIGMGRFGIIGMRERGASVGGILTVTSSANVGTRIELAVPIPPPNI